MPFEIQGNEKLTACLRLRLTEHEKNELRKEAEIAGLSMSELVRRRYFGKPIIASADEAMLRELRRIGGLLKHIHNESQGSYSTLTAKALHELADYIIKLKNDY